MTLRDIIVEKEYLLRIRFRAKLDHNGVTWLQRLQTYEGIIVVVHLRYLLLFKIIDL